MLEKELEEIKYHLSDQCEHQVRIADAIEDIKKSIRALTDYLYNIYVQMPKG